MKFKDIRKGMALISTGWACIDAERLCIVERDPKRKGSAGLFVKCRGPDGAGARHQHRHYLDGMVEGATLLGFRAAP